MSSSAPEPITDAAQPAASSSASSSSAVASASVTAPQPPRDATDNNNGDDDNDQTPLMAEPKSNNASTSTTATITTAAPATTTTTAPSPFSFSAALGGLRHSLDEFVHPDGSNPDTKQLSNAEREYNAIPPGADADNDDDSDDADDEFFRVADLRTAVGGGGVGVAGGGGARGGGAFNAFEYGGRPYDSVAPVGGFGALPPGGSSFGLPGAFATAAVPGQMLYGNDEENIEMQRALAESFATAKSQSGGAATGGSSAAIIKSSGSLAASVNDTLPDTPEDRETKEALTALAEAKSRDDEQFLSLYESMNADVDDFEDNGDEDDEDVGGDDDDDNDDDDDDVDGDDD